MRKGTLVCIVAGLLALPAGASAAAIAYHDIRQQADIYVMRPDGSKQVRLTFTKKLDELDPSFHPSGRSLVYARGGRDGGLVVQPVKAGAKPRALDVGDGDVLEPSYSPDGKLLVYQEDRTVWITPGDSSGQSESVADGLAPSFSPDGKQVIYTRDGLIYTSTIDDFGSAIDGSETVVAGPAPAGGRYVAPAFSPDGRSIAFADNIYDELLVAPLPTGPGPLPEPRIIYVGGGAVAGVIGDVEFSPDGSQLAFRDPSDDFSRISTIGVDGASIDLLTRGFDEGGPDWSARATVPKPKRK